jgi:YegS/Rv2252/BmrU family lipid kinase
MTRFKVILNPASGRGVGGKSSAVIENNLDNLGLDFDLIQTEHRWHAVELAKQAVAEGYDTVVAAGGDGTVNEVINGLMLAEQANLGTASMGVIAIGGGNDFAYGIGIPADLDACCDILAQNLSSRIDIGIVKGGNFPEGRFFGNGMGVGFDAVVGFVAAKLPFTGFLAYLYSAIRTILLAKSPTIRIEYNDQVVTLESLMISIMNGSRLGGGFMIAPEARHNDHLFDICIAGNVSRPQQFALIFKFIQGTHEEHHAIRMQKSERITITAEEGVLPAHVDGETLCEEGSRLEIQLLPEALEVATQST